MKKSKILTLIIAIAFIVLSIPAGLVMAEEKSISPTQTDVKFIHGYDSYTFAYIVDKFDVDLKEGEEVKSYKINGEENPSTGGHIFKNYENTIEFFSTAEAFEGASLGSFTFEVVNDSSEGSVYYTDLTKPANPDWYWDEAPVSLYEEYLNNLEKELVSKFLGDSLTYPSITNLLVSDYFPSSALKLTLYTLTPTGIIFTTSTGKTIKLDSIGYYSFYVLAQDPCKTAIEIDIEKHVVKTINGIEGWYDINDNLIAPIFTFYFDNVKGPEITMITRIQNGCVGLTYNNIGDYITIVAYDPTIIYSLYYSELAVDLYTGDTWADGGIDVLNNAVAAGRAFDVTHDEDIGFDPVSLSFTPNKKGYYYLVVNVDDLYGVESAALNPIKVEAEVAQVKLEKGCFGSLSGGFEACSLAVVAFAFVLKKRNNR